MQPLFGVRIILAVVALSQALLSWSPMATQAEEVRQDRAWVHGTEGEGLLVRAKPNPRAEIVGVLPEGAPVALLRRSEQDGRSWYQVEPLESSRRLRGWVLGAYLVQRPSRARTFMATVTGYASVGDVGACTATGTPVRWGTVAVDPRVIPLGSLLEIDRLIGGFTAEDTGDSVRGASIDVWFPNADAALEWGVQRRWVTVLREGPASGRATPTARCGR